MISRAQYDKARRWITFNRFVVNKTDKIDHYYQLDATSSKQLMPWAPTLSTPVLEKFASVFTDALGQNLNLIMLSIIPSMW